MAITSNNVLKISQAQQILNAFAGKCDERFLKQADVLTYTIKKATTADTGYAATYQLYSVDAESVETAVGAKINIPKDMVVEDGSVVDITYSEGKLYDGATDVTAKIMGETTPTSANAGKYIKLEIANSSGDVLYIAAKDLVDIYTAGNGINVSGNAISVVIDNTSVGGLTVGANGLKLAVVTPDTYSEGTKTADGVAGAMSSADKYKLDHADVTAYEAGNGVTISDHTVSAKVKTGNGLSVDGTDGIQMAVATPDTYTSGTKTADGTAGAMTSADKYKLDNADVTPYEAGNGISISNHSVAAVVDSSNANGLSVGANGIALAAATQSAAGAMSAADKTKLDGIDYATSAEVQEVIDGIFATSSGT